jgi:hypothetical protein
MRLLREPLLYFLVIGDPLFSGMSLTQARINPKHSPT